MPPTSSMPLNDAIRATLVAAASYLRSIQADDGSWQDYDGLPVGPSDAWVTAYVAQALWEVAGLLGDDTADATAAAARWLAQARPHPAGWGYNASTEPDADTTAHVHRLLRCHGHELELRDEAWLRDKWREPGGFATFDGPQAWASVHPCVTPVVYEALPEPDRQRLRPAMVEYLARHRLPNGAWPSYWWRTGHYSTYHNLRLARSLGVELPDAGPVVEAHPHFMVRSTFDLAFVVGCASLTRGPCAGLEAIVRRLLERQDDRGFFEGAEDLRVTHHECEAPWHEPVGQLYVDERHTITTASVIRVLAQGWEQWR